MCVCVSELKSYSSTLLLDMLSLIFLFWCTDSKRLFFETNAEKKKKKKKNRRGGIKKKKRATKTDEGETKSEN